jgi:hypothetical protein
LGQIGKPALDRGLDAVLVDAGPNGLAAAIRRSPTRSSRTY